MLIQSITDSPRDGYPLHVTAKRYWIPEFEANTSDPNALTLILLHSTSFHKETWEPTIERIFALSVQPGSSVKIREAWSLDCPNHGVSGRLNEKQLMLPEFQNNFTCEKYARAVHHFLSGGPKHDARVDFRRRRLVGIGHSLGGNAMLILQHLEPIFTFSSIIIVEPLISPAGPQHLDKLRSILVKGAYERRDVWSNHTTAMKSLRSRERTKKWDPRITDLFVNYAVKPHPGSYCKEAPYHGVTLACSRDQEAAMYRDADGPTQPVADLNKACAAGYVHLVIGAINDFIPARVHAAILDPDSGRKYLSVTKLSDVGHLVPQEAPDRLGIAIYEALTKDEARMSRSKL
ncbi:Alpha/beta hydrolase fold-1 [Collybia nuda]|uniref:Alpha/beta hydrolase fold-1 n=1 Tax=Collybia nuda TaxID=64659 RepID=A0A9P5Y1F0_9AGAR|nr:Alpha/beta hydrolase fold-1 [Collybia nuda]